MQESKQICIVVGVVKNDKGQLLLGKRKDTVLKNANEKWELLGGKIEFGEDPEAALRREIMEESGLEVEIQRLLPKVMTNIWEAIDGSKIQVVILSYECKVVGGQLHTDNFDHKIEELKFFAREQIQDLDLIAKVPDILNLIK